MELKFPFLNYTTLVQILSDHLWLPSILDGTDIRTFPSPWKAQMGSSATKVRDLPYLQSFSQDRKIVGNWVLSFSQAHLTHLTPPSHSGFMRRGIPSLPFSTHQPWWGRLSVLLFVCRVSLTIPFYQDCIVIVCLSLFLTDSKPGFLAQSHVWGKQLSVWHFTALNKLLNN